MDAAMSVAAQPLWGAPRGVAGTFALIAMALKNGGQNRAALRLLDPKPDELVLEIGCGPGAALKRALRMVGPRGFVAGVDASQTASRFAARRIAHDILKARAFVLQAPAHALPFRDAMFDRAFTVNSFGFWPDPARALREIARVLRPGGRLVITQRGSNLDNPTTFAGAEDGIARIGQAAQLLKASGWTLLDERADRDGPRLLALSVLARRD
jgi:ubiquinone/menaquinone biosynthesis C-methylase UbiE